jgi:hypothetical protein
MLLAVRYDVPAEPGNFCIRVRWEEGTGSSCMFRVDNLAVVDGKTFLTALIVSYET